MKIMIIMLIVILPLWECKTESNFLDSKEGEAYGKVFLSFLDEDKYSYGYLMLTDSTKARSKMTFPMFFDYQSRYTLLLGKINKRAGKEIHYNIGGLRSRNSYPVWKGSYRSIRENYEDGYEEVHVTFEENEFRVDYYAPVRMTDSDTSLDFDKLDLLKFDGKYEIIKAKKQAEFENLFQSNNGKVMQYRGMYITKLISNENAEENAISRKYFDFINKHDFFSLKELFFYSKLLKKEMKSDLFCCPISSIKYVGEANVVETPLEKIYNKVIYYSCIIEFKKEKAPKLIRIYFRDNKIKDIKATYYSNQQSESLLHIDDLDSLKNEVSEFGILRKEANTILETGPK